MEHRKQLHLPLDHLKLAPEIYSAELEFPLGTEGISAVYYEGMPYLGKQTRVFAFHGVPEVSDDTEVPGVVLLHGGGGTAYKEWVQIWNDHGYAAIAMDLEGHEPAI
ncbi:MAG TPA: hypothetical protein VGE40_13005 [Bacilli bacterium]